VVVQEASSRMEVCRSGVHVRLVRACGHDSPLEHMPATQDDEPFRRSELRLGMNSDVLVARASGTSVTGAAKSRGILRDYLRTIHLLRSGPK
jgi:hypothetical protein